MSECDRIKARIDFYLDDELSGDELLDFAEHLERCPACRAIVNGQQGFLTKIRQAQPLYEAPEELRSRVSRILEESPAQFPAPGSTPQRGRSQSIAYRTRRYVLAATLLIGLTALAVGLWQSGSSESERKGPSSFALKAVDTHQRHLRGQLPFEISSDSPEQISRWFAGKVPFSLELPNYQESSGQDRLYKLKGARLVSLENDYAAFVGYSMGSREISLVATSATVAKPEGGEAIISKGLTFHYDTIDGLKVITWSDRGLTYALVSDLEERGQQSCIVCHEGTRDRDFIEGLKPGT